MKDSVDNILDQRTGADRDQPPYWTSTRSMMVPGLKSHTKILTSSKYMTNTWANPVAIKVMSFCIQAMRREGG